MIKGVQHSRVGRLPVRALVLGAIASAVLHIGLGATPAVAQPLLPGRSPRPCTLDLGGRGGPYAIPTKCQLDLSAADPDLRFGASMTDTDPYGGHFDYERNEVRRHQPKRVSDPDEIARILTDVYGRHSLLSKSATTVAELAEKAESQSNRALSGINAAADKLVLGAQAVFHNEKLPKFTLRSKINTRYLGLGISANW